MAPTGNNNNSSTGGFVFCGKIYSDGWTMNVGQRVFKKIELLMKNKLLVTLGIFICAIFLNGFEPYDDLKAELILDAKPMLGGGSIWHRGNTLKN